MTLSLTYLNMRDSYSNFVTFTYFNSRILCGIYWGWFEIIYKNMVSNYFSTKNTDTGINNILQQ